MSHLNFDLQIFKMKASLLAILVVVLNVKLITSQTPSVGAKCPEKAPKQSIDIRKLTGQWYEVEASPLFAEWMFNCISIKVASFFEDKSEIRIEAVRQEIGNKYPEPKTIAILNARTSHSTAGKDGRLNVSLATDKVQPVTEFEVNSYVSDIRVLETDYKNWVILWSCRAYKKANARTELVWILSRQRTLSEEHYQSVRDAVVAYNLEGIRTEETIQTGCTYGNNNNDEYTNSNE